ncbi:MAG: hypothetical protein IT162_04695 [Bryobacterales bacterium]|nr:hypothetical protein [Bryobacterales bacterium]
MNVKSFLAIVLAMQLSVGLAAPSAIGIATAKGGFRIDNAAVSGNGTLFSGATVETDRASGQLALRNGARLQLGANSRAKIFENRLVLEQGAGQFRAGEQNQFNLEARSLRIIPADASSVAQVSMVGGNRIHVSALRGSFRVASANGVVVAALAAGRALEFEPSQAGASAPSKLSGCVVSKDGRFFLTDETSNVTVELRGPGLAQQAGHKVDVTGAQLPGVTPVQPAYLNAGMVVQVSEMKMVSRKCALPAAAAAAAGAAGAGAAAGAATAGAAAGAAGAAAGVSSAVVAGVVVAAAATATAVGITVADDDTESRQ